MGKRRKLKCKVIDALVDALDHAEFILATVEGTAELDEGSCVRAGLAVSLADLQARIRKLGKRVSPKRF